MEKDDKLMHGNRQRYEKEGNRMIVADRVKEKRKDRKRINRERERVREKERDGKGREKK